MYNKKYGQQEAVDINAHVVTNVRIAASRAAVFTYLTHLKYHYLWNPQLRDISSNKPLQLGSRYQTTSVILGVKITSDNLITKFVPDTELELENSTGTVHYRAAFRLLEKEGYTLVTCSTTVTGHSSAFAFTTPILRRLARRELQTDMQALKIAVEDRLQ